MTIPLDTSKYFEIVEGLEDVSYYSKTAEGGVFDDPIAAKGKRFPLTEEDIGGDPHVARYGIVWHVWKYHLTDTIAKPDDKIVISEGEYYIYKVDSVSLRNRYRCLCLKVP